MELSFSFYIWVDVVYSWLRKNGLLASDFTCHCGKEAKLNKRNRLKDGYTFRCGSQHEFTMRKNSFFEKSSYNIRDLIFFIKYYIEGHSLHQCALNTGMDYRPTAVNWASYIRELFCQYVFDTYERITFDGEVEIDESIFGRKVKYHKGQPRGLRIWIFSLIERQTNRIILYPVDSRNSETLIPLIQKHVRPGTRIYSDSWAAYMHLNTLGYQHFTVVHKTTFKQRYRNVDTGEVVDCHTNRIEGAWKICKDHFRRINGTNRKLFEQHIAEIVWRNHFHRDNVYEAFFNLLRDIYTLYVPASYTYTVPLFPTWTPPSQEDERNHHMTIIQGSDSETDSPSDEPSTPSACSTPAAVQSGSSHPSHEEVPQVQHNVQPSVSSTHGTPCETASAQPSTSTSITIDTRNITFRKTAKKVNNDLSDDDWEESVSNRKALHHPTQYKPVKRKGKKCTKASTKKKLRNQLNQQIPTVEQLIGMNFLRQTVIFNDNYYKVALSICEGILSKNV